MQVVCPLWSVSGFHLEMRCVPCKAKQQSSKKSIRIIRNHSDMALPWHSHVCAMQSATPQFTNSPILTPSHRAFAPGCARCVPAAFHAAETGCPAPAKEMLQMETDDTSTRHKGVSFLKQSKVAVSQNHSILLPIQEEMEKSSSLNGSFMPIRRKHAAMP